MQEKRLEAVHDWYTECFTSLVELAKKDNITDSHAVKCYFSVCLFIKLIKYYKLDYRVLSNTKLTTHFSNTAVVDIHLSNTELTIYISNRATAHLRIQCRLYISLIQHRLYVSVVHH